MNDLELYREQLALCDDKIIDALVERGAIVEKIMSYKEEYGMPILPMMYVLYSCSISLSFETLSSFSTMMPITAILFSLSDIKPPIVPTKRKVLLISHLMCQTLFPRQELKRIYQQSRQRKR